ncbi:MAG TPA: nuclear transport factor 2 family protein [Burkholderiaceae bacterium]|nr:nuclear transport factor 2 family protein [Burkholderiaceae bacterium]
MNADKALKVARAYANALAKQDVEAIVAISAEDVVCTSPIGQTTGIERFRAFQEGFARMLTTLTVLAVYGDDKQAVVIYIAETQPVPRSVVAELIQVKDGKLASTEVIYDATPFAAFMASVQPH